MLSLQRQLAVGSQNKSGSLAQDSNHKNRSQLSNSRPQDENSYSSVMKNENYQLNKLKLLDQKINEISQKVNQFGLMEKKIL